VSQDSLHHYCESIRHYLPLRTLKSNAARGNIAPRKILDHCSRS
jgi:hypothetical protein